MSPLSRVPTVGALLGLAQTVIYLSTSSLIRPEVLKALLTYYVLYLLFKYRNTALGVMPRPDLPGPRGVPLLGNTIFMLFKRPKNKNYQTQTQLHEEFGKVYTVTVLGFARVINIRDPAMVEHVLKTHFWKYEKGEFFRTVLQPLIGGGIFGADGESHDNHTPAESTSNTDIPMVDLQRIFLLFTLDSFGEIAFGQSFGCLKDPMQPVEFAAAFDRMNKNLYQRFCSPFFTWTEWWTGKDLQIEQDREVIRKFADGVIKERRRRIAVECTAKQETSRPTRESDARSIGSTGGKDGSKRDLMQLFMDAEDENGERLTDESLQDALLNFILAGRDSTAQALSWMFYLILSSESSRDILDKLVSEIDSNLGHGNASIYPSYEIIKCMKFTEACFLESLRIYPAVPHNIKVCMEDDILPGGAPVYKGEMVAWGSWAIGRDKAIWGDDAEEYRPERWLEDEVHEPGVGHRRYDIGKPSPAKFVSFHLGPRACLGRQFATIEAITITSMLLQKFTFKLVDPHTEPAYVQAVTLQMANGLKVRIRRRDAET
ncbi:hypothetical protein BGZ99_006252 [Dissophora globulifera]|uniref:Cytochrome P450 n=1 Tax=Dissophora globulifera TaxID=979702 RepID=A0A9P6RS87_9FUNG|nr:hypothetical protein BGZ99_006252 [Dissophora globulifera]